MKFPLPRPLFPGLAITPADEDEFAALATAFVDKLLAEDHAYRVTNGGQVDTAKWKYIRQTENAAIYYGRGSGHERASPATSPEQGYHKRLPAFLVVSKVAAALDDLMYSFTAPTREATIIQLSLYDPHIADSDILHSIRHPTADAPFSQLNLKWLLLEHSPLLAPRDYIYVDAHGTRTLSNGERIGYRFSHSIELAGAGPLTDLGCVRSNFSTTVIFREDKTHGLVHEYGRMFVAPAGAIPKAVFVTLVARSISSSCSQARIGEAKKLALALYHKHTGKWTVAVPRPTPTFAPSQKSECGVCSRRLNMLNKSRLDCSLCERRLCLSCRIRKELAFLKADLNAKRVRITFCGFCVHQAITLSSHDVAAEEYLMKHDDFYRMPASLRADGVLQPVTSSVSSIYAKEDERQTGSDATSDSQLE